MNHAARIPLYQEIEAERGSRVVAFVTGERVGFQTQIASDAVTPFVALLDAIKPTAKISLILDTTGGQTSAAWRLSNLIRSFCDELEVIIPSKALSSGTLIALGANKIVMTKQAALGPIDPSLDNHPLGPTVTSPTGQQVGVSISAEAVRGYIAEVRKDVTEPAAMAAVWTHLATMIHPLALGQIFRSGSQIRMLADDLLVHQIENQAAREKIINLLSSESGSHDYTINRRQALELGLNVEKSSALLYSVLSGVTKSYTHELKTFEPFSLQTVLAGNPPAPFSLARGLIESTDTCYGFMTEGIVDAQTFQMQKSFEGWRELP